MLRDIITRVIKAVGMSRACDSSDGIKNLGYLKAYEGGLSFNLDDIIIPAEKADIVKAGNERVEQIMGDYGMGFITDNERYNQVIDTWTKVNSDIKSTLMKQMTEADQGFNAVFMMLDSGARGSADQIAQLAGMRGLMAKPQKPVPTPAPPLRTPSFPTLRKVCPCSSTSSPPTVPVRVSPIRP